MSSAYSALNLCKIPLFQVKSGICSNQFIPGVPDKGHCQTVETQIRHSNMWVYTACMKIEFFQQNYRIRPNHSVVFRLKPVFFLFTL